MNVEATLKLIHSKWFTSDSCCSKNRTKAFKVVCKYPVNVQKCEKDKELMHWQTSVMR